MPKLIKLLSSRTIFVMLTGVYIKLWLMMMINMTDR